VAWVFAALIAAAAAEEESVGEEEEEGTAVLMLIGRAVLVGLEPTVMLYKIVCVCIYGVKRHQRDRVHKISNKYMKAIILLCAVMPHE
jgi:hypothetical protein